MVQPNPNPASPSSRHPRQSSKPQPSTNHRLGVVFDFDGLIVDSETPEFEAYRQIYAEHGLTLTADEWCHEVGIWTGTRDWFVKLGELTGKPVDAAALREEKRKRFWQVVKMETLPGIRELLDQLQAANVPLAVASSSEAWWIHRAMKMLEVTDYFRAVITGDDPVLEGRRKPHPFPYLLAASKLGVEPGCCVGIEDSHHGLTAVKAAGMKAIAIPNWLTEKHDLSAADLRVASARELSVDRLRQLTADR